MSRKHPDGQPIGRPMQSLTVDPKNRASQNRARKKLGLTFGGYGTRSYRIRNNPAALHAYCRNRIAKGWTDRTIAKRLRMRPADIAAIRVRLWRESVRR